MEERSRIYEQSQGTQTNTAEGDSQNARDNQHDNGLDLGMGSDDHARRGSSTHPTHTATRTATAPDSDDLQQKPTTASRAPHRERSSILKSRHTDRVGYTSQSYQAKPGGNRERRSNPTRNVENHGAGYDIRKSGNKSRSQRQNADIRICSLNVRGISTEPRLEELEQ